ncbi:MAG: hypothetical protein SOX91_03780 [Bacteroides pyogenes]|nr:hypothetical protein [Bacteroides pyogenes]
MNVIAAILPAIRVKSPHDCFASLRIIMSLSLSWENIVSIRFLKRL